MAVIGLWWWHSSRAKLGRRVQEPGPGSGVVPGVSPVPPQQSPGRAAAQEPDRPPGAGECSASVGISPQPAPAELWDCTRGPKGQGPPWGLARQAPVGGCSGDPPCGCWAAEHDSPAWQGWWHRHCQHPGGKVLQLRGHTACDSLGGLG